MWLKSALSGAALLVSLCGSLASAETRDIGSDVGANGKVRLYWLDGEILNRGTCDSVRPLMRSNCSADVVPHSLSDVHTHLRQNKDARKTELDALKATLDQRLAAIDDALNQDPNDADLSYERAIVAEQIDTVVAELTTVTAYIENVESFINKLKNTEIVFHMMQTSDRYVQYKDLMALLAQYYNEATTPEAPDARIWQDPITKINFAAVARRISHADAPAVCRELFGEGWAPAAPFSDCANCPRNLMLLSRLIHSPLTEILPQTPYGDLGNFTRVWTNATYEHGGQPVALSYNLIRNSYGYSSHTGLLPVICEGQ